MQPSTAPTQSLPAYARTTYSSAAPSLGVPGGFGDALTQALASPEPAGPAAPAIPAPTEMTALPAQAFPALPTVAAAPQADPAAVNPSKPEDEPVASATSATEAKEDKPAGKAAKPSEELQAPAPFEPILPAPPQAVPSAAAPMAAQPVASPPQTDGAAPSTGQDSSTAPVASVESRQPPSASAPAAVQITPPAAAPPSHPAVPSEADDTAAHAVQKHSVSVMAEEEPSAALPVLPAEAAPLPPVASAPLPNAAPASLGVAPHPAPAPAPPQAPAHSPAAGRPVLPPAAAQVGPALASFAASASHAGAPQHLTIRLDPMDLGRVQVRIERSPDGSARVDLKVEKPDTLLLLLRDQPQLHRALDLAGVPSTERTLQFHLAPPDAAAPGGMAAQSNADSGHGQHRPGQPHSGRFAAHGTGGALSSGELIPGPAAFRRAGVDITA